MAGILSRPLELLSKSELTITSPIDHPYWNYRPVLGGIQRLRFRVILEILAEAHFPRMLEIGYGSGLFMPELAKHCAELHGVDPHQRRQEVEANLAASGLRAELATANAECLPYETGFFQCVVSVSTLEYVPDIETACREMRRVLSPGGTLAVCTPGTSPLWDIPLHLMTREGPGQYENRRHELQPALRRHFRLIREVRLPPIGGSVLRLYTGLHLRAD